MLPFSHCNYHYKSIGWWYNTVFKGLQVTLAIDTIEVFSKASGLCLTLNKCELLAIKDCNAISISDIRIKGSIECLGITIDKNDSQRSSVKFNPTFEKTREKMAT